MDSRIIDKISGLMAHMANPANMHEAEVAAGRLQALLSKHQISMLEAEALIKEGEPKPELRTADYEIENHSSWRALLLNGVATQNFCRAVRGWERTRHHSRNYAGMRRGTGYTLVGSAENIAAVVQLYEYLEATIERLSAEYVAAQTAQHKPIYDVLGKRWNPKGIGNDFRRGAVIGIVTKLYHERFKAADAAGSSALVIAKDAELDRYLEDMGAGQDTRQKTALVKVRETVHYERGIQAGLGIGLESQLTQTGASGIISATSEGS